ncbi:MAG: response regulator transcription factor [Verrucomicrobiales bacterium]|nr:response regulator transcription factor [Verrucomicrobiales bacterium]
MRILVVEDEPDLLSGLASILREEGYAVDEAEDGEIGLHKALWTDYDAVILDVMLPGINGFQVLERLRVRKTTPVLLLTARDQSSDRVRGLDSGADDYLPKPFDLPELLARIRALIRRSAGQPSAKAEFGNVAIDFNARSVHLDGNEVSLTGREYALVSMLAQHRDRVFTRAQLYEHLFDEMDDSSSNLLDVHVSNVRKKLGKDIIVTRRGHGYGIRSSAN